jgi:hypothetical protein
VYVCMRVCMYVCMYTCIMGFLKDDFSRTVSKYALYVIESSCVCTYVCMYVYMYTSTLGNLSKRCFQRPCTLVQTLTVDLLCIHMYTFPCAHAHVHNLKLSECTIWDDLHIIIARTYMHTYSHTRRRSRAHLKPASHNLRRHVYHEISVTYMHTYLRTRIHTGARGCFGQACTA